MSLPGQLSGFAVVGAVATGFQYGLMAILIDLFGFGAVLASTMSYTVSALMSYGLNRCLVFRSSIKHVYALPRFVIIVIIGLLLNTGLIYLVMATQLLHWLFAQMLVTLTVMVSNFVLSKYWVFDTGNITLIGK